MSVEQMIIKRSEAAALLGRDPEELLYWARKGINLPVIRFSTRGEFKYRLSDVKKFLEQGPPVLALSGGEGVADYPPEPDTAAEFSVQAELYIRLRERGFDARGEVTVADCIELKTVRIDIGLFDTNGKLFLAIEVKRRRLKTKSEAKRVHRQLVLQRRICNCRCVAVCGREDVKRFLEAAESGCVLNYRSDFGALYDVL